MSLTNVKMSIDSTEQIENLRKLMKQAFGPDIIRKIAENLDRKTVQGLPEVDSQWKEATEDPHAFRQRYKNRWPDDPDFLLNCSTDEVEQRSPFCIDGKSTDPKRIYQARLFIENRYGSPIKSDLMTFTDTKSGLELKNDKLVPIKIDYKNNSVILFSKHTGFVYSIDLKSKLATRINQKPLVFSQNCLLNEIISQGKYSLISDINSPTAYLINADTFDIYNFILSRQDISNSFPTFLTIKNDTLKIYIIHHGTASGLMFGHYEIDMSLLLNDEEDDDNIDAVEFLPKISNLTKVGESTFEKTSPLIDKVNNFIVVIDNSMFKHSISMDILDAFTLELIKTVPNIGIGRYFSKYKYYLQYAYDESKFCFIEPKKQNDLFVYDIKNSMTLEKTINLSDISKELKTQFQNPEILEVFDSKIVIEISDKKGNNSYFLISLKTGKVIQELVEPIANGDAYRYLNNRYSNSFKGFFDTTQSKDFKRLAKDKMSLQNEHIGKPRRSKRTRNG